MTVEIDDQFVVAGEEITFDQADELRLFGNQLICAAEGEVKVDLGGLVRANSVTVAILMDWFRSATLQQKTIVCVNLSDEMRNIVEFSGLSAVLID